MSTSTDLIVFDPAELDGMSGTPERIMAAIDRYMREHGNTIEQPEPAASKSIQALLDSLSGNYLDAYLSANGRFCSINSPGIAGSWDNALIAFYEDAKEQNLILIDPQGNVPIMASPCGNGLLDCV